MTDRITRLSADTINRIAAGEVVQRPSAALKELLENSLDAGATRVRVSVADGGVTQLQIADDGSGIHPDDLPLLCARYATSKLRRFEDLMSMSTFGFRGEALASISYAAARVVVVTRRKDDALGHQASYSDGVMIEAAPAAVPADYGTTLTVEGLFAQDALRRQAYLHRPLDEFHAICDVVSKYALSHPTVGFYCTQLGTGAKGGVALPPNPQGTALDVVRSRFGGPMVARKLRPFSIPLTQCGPNRNGEATATPPSGSHEQSNSNGNRNPCGETFYATGLLSDLSLASHAKRSTFILFVNGRLVDSTTLRRVVDMAYAPYMVGNAKSWWVLVELRVAPHTVDVNVHPTKHEVLLLHEEAVTSALYAALRQGINDALSALQMDAAKVPVAAAASAASSTSPVGQQLLAPFRPMTPATAGAESPASVGRQLAGSPIVKAELVDDDANEGVASSPVPSKLLGGPSGVLAAIALTASSQSLAASGRKVSAPAAGLAAAAGLTQGPMVAPSSMTRVNEQRGALLKYLVPLSAAGQRGGGLQPAGPAESRGSIGDADGAPRTTQTQPAAGATALSAILSQVMSTGGAAPPALPTAAAPARRPRDDPEDELGSGGGHPTAMAGAGGAWGSVAALKRLTLACGAEEDEDNSDPDAGDSDWRHQKAIFAAKAQQHQRPAVVDSSTGAATALEAAAAAGGPPMLTPAEARAAQAAVAEQLSRALGDASTVDEDTTLDIPDADDDEQLELLPSTQKPGPADANSNLGGAAARSSVGLTGITTTTTTVPLLASVAQARRFFATHSHPELAALVRHLVFVGSISPTHALVQSGTALLMLDVPGAVMLAAQQRVFRSWGPKCARFAFPESDRPDVAVLLLELLERCPDLRRQVRRGFAAAEGALDVDEVLHRGKRRPNKRTTTTSAASQPLALPDIKREATATLDAATTDGAGTDADRALMQRAVAMVVSTLTEWRDMYDEYFGLALDLVSESDDGTEASDSRSSVKLEPGMASCGAGTGQQRLVISTVPALMGPHFPIHPGGLPLLLLRLATDVDYSDEARCFAAIARELALLYSFSAAAIPRDCRNSADSSNETGACGVGPTSIERAAALVRDAVIPALRMADFAPPLRGMWKEKVLQTLVTTEQLYRVFERC